MPASQAEDGNRADPQGRGLHPQFKLAEEGPKKTIKIYLKYTPDNEPVISQIERVSRPGCRVYVGAKTKFRACWAARASIS